MERAAVLLDTRMSNTERAEIFRVFASFPIGLPPRLSLIPRASASLYPPSAVRAFGDGSLEGKYDAFIPLSMCDFATILAFTRSAVRWHPNAFVLPTGGVQPHEMKEGKRGRVQYSETDETFARLLVGDREAYRLGLYGKANVAITDPLSAYDLLPTTRRVCDTEGNADDVRARLAALRDFLGRPLRIGVVAPRIFAARACANFRSSISTDIVPAGGIRAVIPSVPFFDDTETWYRWGYLIQLQVMVSEYLKRLYMVCVG